jgi:uridylate kinase
MESGSRPRYSRILLKISGEALSGAGSFGIEPEAIDSLCSQIEEIRHLGIQIAVVVGGGNFLRGSSSARLGINRIAADAMGMLATIINALALQDRLERSGCLTQVMSAVRVDAFAEAYQIHRAICQLQESGLIILAGGTGSPFFSTDTAAALRASELKADVVLKATNVDGVFSDDPKKNSRSVYYPRLNYMDLVKRELRVMDLTAVTICKDNNIPIIVFDMMKPGNLKKVVMGESVGTIISN